MLDEPILNKLIASPNTYFRKRLFKYLAIPASVLALIEPVVQIIRYAMVMNNTVITPPTDVFSEGGRYTVYALLFGPWILYQAARSLPGSNEYTKVVNPPPPPP